MPGVILAHVLWDDLTDPNADTAITTHHYKYPITPAQEPDYNAFVLAFTSFFNAIANRLSSDISVTQIRSWDLPTTPGTPLGSADHVSGFVGGGGSGADRLPPQIACSVTEETSIRKRWGRFYIPGFVVTDVSSSGRFADSVTTQIADAAQTMYNEMNGAGRGFVSYRRSDATFQLVSGIRVDDVPDTIRRRRFSMTLARKLRPVT
jgi:hypothetical protein